MSYGPKLTPAQYRRLQAEIEAFKNNKDAEPELRAEIERAATGGKDIDAYQKWVDENGGREMLEANPDQLSDESPSPWGQVSKADTTGLSDLEKEAWELCKELGYSAGDAAIEIGTTVHAINSAIRRATKKLKGQL